MQFTFRVDLLDRMHCSFSLSANLNINYEKTELYDLCKAIAYYIRGLKLYLAKSLLFSFVKCQIPAVWLLNHQVISGIFSTTPQTLH